ncbi:MAG: hypothetical protein JST89_13525 [Cyanobacteria bacterium SZAS-4]|nr:hypothetical protein [Cyanobacteria bacterium SZAS-4]
MTKLFFEHYPILDSLKLEVAGGHAASFPSYFGFMLECATSNNRDPICFVLPHRKNIAGVLTILYAISEIQNRFPEWVVNYANQIPVGTHVAVLPGREVFEYGGVWKEWPGQFQLKVLGSRKSCRSFPIREVLRLEKTEKSRPKGALDKAFPENTFEVPIDQLLKINSFGNRSVFECTTLLYGDQQDFCSLLNALVLLRESIRVNLADIFTVGFFNSNSEILVEGAGSEICSPMVGVSNRPLHISRRAREIVNFTQLFVVDGADRLAKNMQTFDQVASRQKLIVVASAAEYDTIKQLNANGCIVWELTTQELSLAAIRDGQNYEFAQNLDKAQVLTEQIEGAELNAVVNILNQLEFRLSTHDEGDHVQPILMQCIHLLLDLSWICSSETDIEILSEKLRKIESEVSKSKMFLAVEVSQQLLKTVEHLKRALDTYLSAVPPKVSWLRNELKQSSSAECAVVARHKQAKADMKKWISDEFPDVLVVTSTELVEIPDGKILLIPGWPGRKKWKAICQAHSCSTIKLAGFVFELQWLKFFQQNSNAVLKSLELTIETKGKLLDLDIDDLPKSSSYLRFDIPVNTELVPTPSTLIEKIESESKQKLRKDQLSIDDSAEVKSARYVSFIGDGYAYITDGCRLPLLMINSQEKISGVKIVTGAELEPEDVVVFREHGDVDVIQLLASEIAGKSHYQDLRRTASLWRTPLQRIRADKRLIEKWLSEVGLSRSVQTINLWLNDPDLIGPTNEEDIAKIAKMTRDPYLTEHASEVAAAIKQVRKLHQQAGRHLTDVILEQLPDEIDSEVKIELEVGEAFVVEVEAIDDRTRNYPAVQVNKLNIRS